MLLERTHETACIREAVEAVVATGDGRVVVLLGQGGVGKTSLLDFAADCANHAGATVARARGVALESELPFGVARSLLRDDDHLDGSFSGALHRLSWRAMDLAEEAPLILIVDDAHEADEPSLRMLHFLARRLSGVPIGIFVAARDVRRSTSGVEAFLTLEGTRVLRPATLSAEAAAEVVRRRCPDADDAFAAECHAATGGNPLLIVELLRAASAEGLAPHSQSIRRLRELGPAPVARSVRLALSELPPESTDLVRAIAILGDAAPWSAAAGLAGIGIDAALRTGGALVEAGILAPTSEPTFIHPIIRAAVLAEMNPAEQALGHRRAAEVLRNAGSPVTRIAGHLLEAPPAADSAAVATLREVAALATRRGTAAAAVPFLRRALAEPPEPGQLADVLAELAAAEVVAGERDAADHFATLEQLTPEGVERIRVTRDRGLALYAGGRFAEAIGVVETALAELGDGDDELARELDALWAGSAPWAGVSAEAIRERVAGLLERPQVGGIAERRLLAHLAAIEMMRAEDCDRAVALALRAWENGKLLEHLTLSDPSLWSVPGALLNAGALDQARPVLDAIRERARQEGAYDAHANESYFRAYSELYAGRIAEAEAAAQTTLDAGRDGFSTYHPAALWVAARCRLERGDVAGAARLVAIDAETEAAWAGSPVAGALVAARAEIALAAGNPAQALEHAESQGAVLQLIGSRNPLFFGWRATAAIACAKLGRAADAHAHAMADLEAARASGLAAAIGPALRITARLESPSTAVPLLEDAVARLEGSGYGLELGRALTDLGTALRASGERGRAKETLRHALDLATRGDATVLAAHAREELVAVGGRPRRAHIFGPESLTASERRVVDRAIAGESNREIAEALFVTRKAVEYHLANAFRKLDVRRREDLADALGTSMDR